MLYLVRHAQTAWNAEQRAQGHSDIPLDDEGRRQAQALGEAFHGRPVDLVLCSDLERARETAQPIVESTGAPYEETPLLRERGFGDWEGETFPDISNWWVGLEVLQNRPRLELRPPNGESFQDVWDRLGPVVERLVAAEQNIVVVTHGGTCGLLLARLINGTLLTSRSFRFANTSVTTLERRPEGMFNIIGYNDTAHLSDELVLTGSVDGASR